MIKELLIRVLGEFSLYIAPGQPEPVIQEGGLPFFSAYTSFPNITFTMISSSRNDSDHNVRFLSPTFAYYVHLRYSTQAEKLITVENSCSSTSRKEQEFTSDDTRNLVTLFYKAATQHAEQPAIVSDAMNVITFAEVRAWAQRLAERIIELTEGEPIEIIPILAGCCPELVIGQIAVVLSGSAFCCLDPEVPKRNKDILRQLRPKILLHLQQSITNITGLNLYAMQTLCLEEALRGMTDNESGTKAPSAKQLTLPASVTPNSQAYLVFTSGTTGIPKAVSMLEQH